MLWHRVISGTTPWMASQYPADCKIKAVERTVLTYCLNSILAARRSEAACWRCKGGDASLIEEYRQQ